MPQHKGVSVTKHAVESPRNIVVFGESGVGKSSLINLIAGQPVALTSNDARGCTSRHERYKLRVDDTPYIIWDTPGLNEGAYGTAPADTAEKNLKRLLHDLSKANDIHLLIYCVSASRLRKAMLGNYNFFYSAICRKKVPIVAVVTGLENYGEQMEDWWVASEAEFVGLKMHFDGHACVTTLNTDEVDSPVLKQRCHTSRQVIHSLITSTCARHREGLASTVLAHVRAMSRPTQKNSVQPPVPIIAIYHLPEGPLSPTTTIKDASPFEGGRLMDVGGSSFLVYRILDQHLHAGMRFKRQVALREADLLIICASVHSNSGASLWDAVTTFYGSYGGETRPLLVIAKDAVSDEKAREWWNTFDKDQRLHVIIRALPRANSPGFDACASVVKLQQTIQMRSLEPVDVPPAGCFGWLVSRTRRHSPMLSMDGNIREDCLVDSNVWSPSPLR